MSGRFKSSALFLGLLLLVGPLLTGCGGGSSLENKELTLGNIGWDENAVISNLTKILLEEDLGYGEVTVQTIVELGPVFEGVASGDLAAFQDVWLPNHQAQLDAVENDVVQLDPWYLGETELGIAVPTYMNVTSIEELNQAGVDQILGIEPSSIIMERIPDETMPTYNLDQNLVESSTAGMLSEVDNRYNNRENFAFIAWRPHWMNQAYDFKYLEDPEDTLGELNDSSTVTSIVNEDLPEDDPLAYALMLAIKLTEEQVNEIENVNPDDYEQGVRTWLGNNRNVVQPWIDAAKRARDG